MYSLPDAAHRWYETTFNMVAFGKKTMKPTRLTGRCQFLLAIEGVASRNATCLKIRCAFLANIRKTSLAFQNIGIARSRAASRAEGAPGQAKLYKVEAGGRVGGNKEAQRCEGGQGGIG